MNKQIHFEDNIFILMIRLRMIRDVITLNADPELFLEKTLDDIYFADHTLKILLRHLQENPRLIEREEVLEHLAELEWEFSLVLKEMLKNSGNISIQEIPSIREKLLALEENSRERRKTAQNLGPINSMPDETVVSPDELNELLKAF